MTVTKRLTRKVGPAPLWAWLVVALAGTYLVYRHFRTPSSSATLNATPVAVTSDVSGSGTGATGSGSSSSPADSSSGDLLSALDASTSSFDSLLSALQAAGGGAGVTGGTGGSSGSSSSSSAAAATTPDPNAPPDQGVATTDNTNAWAFPALISGGQTNGSLPVDQQIPGLPANAYVIGGPAQVAPPQPFGVDNTPDALNRYIANQGGQPVSPSVASPTPATVTPAPTQIPTPGHRVAA